MSTEYPSTPPKLPDAPPWNDALPPVQPPNARFLVQLFVIPGMIVLIIVMIWMMFHWLAQMGNDSDAFIKALEADNANRWHAAYNLSHVLRTDGDASLKLKQDVNTANRLAAILTKALKEPRLNDNSKSEGLNAEGIRDAHLALRSYLATALGYFHTREVLPVLLVAASQRERPDDDVVRREAFRSIAMLSTTLKSLNQPPLSHPELIDVLLIGSEDEAVSVREAATFALGTIPVAAMPPTAEQGVASTEKSSTDKSDRVTSRLRALLYDGEPNVRYNAATGLAEQGDMRCVPVLLDMLEPEQKQATKNETGSNIEFKRTMILVNGMRATKKLMSFNPKEKQPKLEAAVAVLTDDSSREVRDTAVALQAHLQLDRSKPSAAP